MKKELIKKILMVLLAILGVAALGVSLFLAQQNKALKKELEEGAAIEIRGAQAEESPVETAVKSLFIEEEAPSTPGSEEGQLKITPALLDFGTISKKEGIVKGSLELENTGETPLELKYAFASCGCTTSNLAKQALEPGAKITLPVTYDPNYFAAEIGLVQKKITIFSNDPKAPFRKIFLQAKVVP